MTDVHDRQRSSAQERGFVVELGPGGERRVPSALTIDRCFGDATDVVADLEAGLPFLADASISEIHSHHVLEHIQNLPQLLAECSRVLVPGGLMLGTVPHFSNPYFYSDPTHQKSFGLYTFAYFCSGSPLRREVPRYSELRFHCRSLRLGFRSPFRRRNRWKRLLERMANRSPWTLEFYEEHLCFVFPAYEIHFCLVKSP